MTTPDSPSPVLEEAAQAFADATAKPPYLFDLSVEDGRRTVDSTQDGDFPDPAATRQDLTVPGGPTGEVSITVYRPAGRPGRSGRCPWCSTPTGPGGSSATRIPMTGWSGN